MRSLTLLSCLKRVSSATAHIRQFQSRHGSQILSCSRGPPIRLLSSLPPSPIFQAVAKHDPSTTAVIHSVSNRTFQYGSLLHDVAAAKEHLSTIYQGQSLRGERIAFLAENSYDYVVTFLAILAQHAVALPLAPSFPSSEIRYILEDSGAVLLLSTPKFQDKAEDVLKESLQHKPVIGIIPKTSAGAEAIEPVEFDPSIDAANAGLMLYTSGTTNRPKGVLLSASAVFAQAESLIEAWKYSPSDSLLHILPLHHIHGVINALITPLVAGSSIEFLYPFNPDTVWKRLAAPFLDSSSSTKKPVTFLTAVPTIYSRLLSTHPLLPEDLQHAAKTAISPENMRLNISGSAALPTPIKSAWTDLSNGNVLLERYGMTEVGMALSCGLSFADRIDGSVGWPLPSVEVRLVDTDVNEVIEPGQEIDTITDKVREGEIQLRGPTIFTEYFRNPTATNAEFVQPDPDDGNGKWFKTGDVAIRESVNGAGENPEQYWARGPMYFIRGRKSVDIIKVGGEKVSALEVERELLSLPEISEVAVVGLPSEKWGQKVAAVIVLSATGEKGGKGGKPLGVMDMRRALKGKLAPFKIPHEVTLVKSIPRNAMGKINKKTLVKEVFPSSTPEG